MKLTEKQLASYVGLDLNALKAWISCKSKQPYSIVWRVCELLYLEPEDLLEK